MVVVVVQLKKKELVWSKQNQPTRYCLPSPKITGRGLVLSTNAAALWVQFIPAGEARQEKQGEAWFPWPSSAFVHTQTKHAPSPSRCCPGLAWLGPPPCPPNVTERGDVPVTTVGTAVWVVGWRWHHCWALLPPAQRGCWLQEPRKGESDAASRRWRDSPRVTETYTKCPVCF